MKQGSGPRVEQGSGPRGRGAFRWTWPVGVRVMLAAVMLISGLALRLKIFWRGIDSATAFRPAPDLVIDPNTAPASVLEALPHLGPSLVNRLIAEREVRPFESMEDLRRRVRGLGPATMGRLGPYLRIERPSVPVARRGESTMEPSMVPAQGAPRLARAPNVPADR